MKNLYGLNRFIPYILFLTAVLGASLAPRDAHADRLNDWIHRQDLKDQWRNLAYLGAGVAALGAVSHNDYLVGAGVAGGLYSLYRFNADCGSHDPLARHRYEFYNRPSLEVHGVTYHRVTVNRGGQRFYAFKRGPNPAPARTHKVRR